MIIQLVYFNKYTIYFIDSLHFPLDISLERQPLRILNRRHDDQVICSFDFIVSPPECMCKYAFTFNNLTNREMLTNFLKKKNDKRIIKTPDFAV